MELVPAGTVIDGYEVLKPLGKGKFSVVYTAKRQADGKQVALKKMNIFDMMDHKQREKCLREVTLLKSLTHPHIIRILDSFISDKEMVIILEWAERGDLKRVLRRALSNDVCLPEGQIWDYMRQLSSALAYMQNQRIMHRDVKPANIFLAEDGSLKLGDLGLGRFFSSGTLEAFSKVGTPLYMSPEVLKGNGYDMKSDVWSLGCVFYELCMKRSPFKQKDQQMSLYDLFLAISKGEYTPLPESFCADMRSTVEGMLELEVSRRMSMADVAAVCLKHSSAQPRARPSPLLIMDDIVEKLKLLNADELFLAPRCLPPIHKCFFAMPCSGPSQLGVAAELISWLAPATTTADASAGPSSSGPSLESTPRSDGGGDAAAGGGRVRWIEYDPSASPEATVKRLQRRLEPRGLRVTSSTTLTQLRQGHGEGVCLILNELINQELVRRDFHFHKPDWTALEDDAASVGAVSELIEPEEEVSESEEDLEHCPAFGVSRQEWAEELERVLPQLRVAVDVPEEAARQARIGAAAKEAREVQPILVPALEAFASARSKELESVRLGEARLKPTFASLGDRVGRARAAVDDERTRAGEAEERTEARRQELARVTESHERTSAELRERAQTVQDDRCVRKARDAVDKIRAEIRELTVRQGVLRHVLDQRRIRQPTARP